MERRFCPPEKHPILAVCNVITMTIGVVMTFQATIIGPSDQAGWSNSIFLIGIALVFLGTNTGKLTQNFRHWDYGLTIWQKIFASLSIYIGVLAGGWVILNLFHS